MDLGIIIPSRLLPKTGQETSYRTNDDGDIQAGWWKGLSVANNRERFISKTIDGDDIVIDNATGLTWPAFHNSSICNNGNTLIWSESIDYPIGLSFGGFTDWRLPNVLELISIIDYGSYNPTIYSTFFTALGTDTCWTSTTSIETGDKGVRVRFGDGTSILSFKVIMYKIRPVRGGV